MCRHVKCKDGKSYQMKEWEETLQVHKLGIPCSPSADHGEADVPLEPMEEHRDSEIHLQSCGGASSQRSWISEREL